MNHSVRLAANIVFVTVMCLTSFSENEQETNQTKGQIIADCVNASSGLNIKGNIYINNEDTTPRNPDDLLPVQFFYTSVAAGLKGNGFMHTRATSQVRDGLISEFLDNVPDLTSLRHRLFIEKPRDDIPPLADFTLYIVSRADGYLSDLSNQAQERLVFHEQALRTSGFATVVFSPQYDAVNIEHYKLFLSALQEFSKLASELDCQNIWVTVKLGNRQELGLCWKEDFEVIIQEPH